MLGLTVMALGLAITLPQMKTGLEVEQSQRAKIEARSLAVTILEYRRDTGGWPPGHDGLADLAALTAPEPATGRQSAQAGLVGTFSPAAMEPAWLKDIPLDPWGQPYRAYIPREETGMILVVSAGRNGILETSRDQLDNIQRGDRMNSGPVFCGDDIGYLIKESNQTGRS